MVSLVAGVGVLTSKEVYRIITRAVRNPTIFTREQSHIVHEGNVTDRECGISEGCAESEDVAGRAASVPGGRQFTCTAHTVSTALPPQHSFSAVGVQLLGHSM